MARYLHEVYRYASARFQQCYLRITRKWERYESPATSPVRVLYPEFVDLMLLVQVGRDGTWSTQGCRVRLPARLLYRVVADHHPLRFWPIYSSIGLVYESHLIKYRPTFSHWFFYKVLDSVRNCIHTRNREHVTKTSVTVNSAGIGLPGWGEPYNNQVATWEFQ